MPENPLVLVRPNLPRDATAVAELIVAACQQAYAFFAWNETVVSIGEWLAEDPLRWSETWVAEANGSVVAFMALENNFIDQLFVAPPWQGKAIGARLMALAKLRYPHGLTLHCAQQNWPAIAFYRRQGFIVVGYHRNHEHGIGITDLRWSNR